MIPKVYVIYDELENKYNSPFVAASDAEACTLFYGRTHGSNLMPGKQYSYKLFRLVEDSNSDKQFYLSFDHARMIAVSSFIVEGPKINEFHEVI